jgi:hypothetical protein
MIRFAGLALKPLLAKAARVALPQTGRGWAMDVVPNTFFAGLSALSLPEGTDAGTRAGAFAEDMATSLPLSLLGRVGGYGMARGIGRMRNRPLSQDSLDMVQGLSGAGLETVAWGSGLVPRPFAQGAWDRYNEQMQLEQMQYQAMRDREIRDQTLQELGGAGMLIAPFQQQLAGSGLFGGYG